MFGISFEAGEGTLESHMKVKEKNPATAINLSRII